MPAVSVIITTYNRRDLLPRAVQSVLNQSARDFELIVIDDGSDDGTDSLPFFDGCAPRVRYIRMKTNRGVSRARNRGAAAAAAPLIAFLDSDDQWHDEKLRRHLSWIDNNPGYRISQTGEIWIRDGTRVNPPAPYRKFAGDLFAESLERCMVTPSSVIMEKTLLEETGGFNENLPVCEDYDLWLRITCCRPVGLVDEFLLTRYSGHPGQLSASGPGLDRYRVRSIMDLLGSGTLSEEQAVLARRALAKKATVVANGCRKRGRIEEYDRYREIADRYA